ncbi:50S ribosomal protein L11 methyltransferase [Bryobacter aggregatus]|uniref:50S ribosomal protein L11 methyltransferase n=1 Tax=Bryobacter aggregatus TaxID=360054 RepID=UPI0004E22CAF|nr:50S ribosomal protein L11 methyltransferase [Bryobacter aggregatus]
MPNFYILLPCSEEEKDILISDLFDAGTTGIAELDEPEGRYTLKASFDTREAASGFGVEVFEDATDWVTISHLVWKSRLVGERFYFAPSWSDEATPEGRWRIDYQDGAACGSGEHPSTRHALEAIEKYLQPGMRLLDLGCGAGILSRGARLLGAGLVVGVDVEDDSCHLTRQLSGVPVVQGMADCIASESFDIVAANISAAVLVNFADEILRIVKPDGVVVLAGFGVEEADRVKQIYGLPLLGERSEGEWSSLVFRMPAMG